MRDDARGEPQVTADQDPRPALASPAESQEDAGGRHWLPRLPRPWGLRLLVVALLASPLVHVACRLAGVRILNYGGPTWWDAAIYMVISPLVGTLLLLRHERARFSAYVFLSCEILRGFRIHSTALIVLAAAAILYFQLPAARAVYPRVDPAAVRRRLRSLVRR